QYLQLIATLNIDTAVTAGLTAGRGHKGRAELDVQRVIAELLLSNWIGGPKVLAVDQFAVFPLINGTAVEQHDRPFRCFFAERGTLTLHLLERGGGLALDQHLEFSS